MSLFERGILPSFREESELSSDGGLPITGAPNKELLSVEEPLASSYEGELSQSSSSQKESERPDYVDQQA